MTSLINKSLISALSFLFVMAFSPMTSATENPFGMSNVDANQITVAEGKCGEGKCGEGKCGGKKAKKDGKCGDDKAKKDGKCGGDKKGEHKDHAGHKDEKKGKCGEGKCGGKK